MSSALGRPQFTPLIALVHRVNKVLQADMVGEAHRRGHPEVKQAHNAVFATLQPGGSRAVDMAAWMGITRQSMGEILRDMVDLGLLEMVPDPADRRAKLVRYTATGRAVARDGYTHIHELEARLAEAVGTEAYATTRNTLELVVGLLGQEEADSDEPPAPSR